MSINKRHLAAINKENNTVQSKPELVEEWNYQKNAEIMPNAVSLNTNRKVWWICSKCGFEWEAAVSNRNKGTGCPACANQRLWPGHNDLATLFPELALEWNYQRNEGLQPNDFVAGGHTKVWWKCSKCGAEWNTSIKLRVDGRGCPKCKFSLHTSLPEQILFYFIRQTFPEAINSYSPDFLHGKELDIFIPTIGVGIEYDGAGWHNNAEKDQIKTSILSSHDIFLIRIREPRCPTIDDGSFCIITEKPDKDFRYLEGALSSLSQFFEEKHGVLFQIEQKPKDIYLQVLTTFAEKQKQRSLAALHPNLIAEWDEEKNGGLLPDQVLANSNVSVWWKCPVCNHSWRANVDRRSRGAGCPRCAGEVVWPGKNDLETTFPEILRIWNYDKNSIRPCQIMGKSHKKVWWKCDNCDFEWQAPVYNVVVGHGCPACANQIVREGYNDLQTTNPLLVKEWLFERNLDLVPNDVTAGSKKKVWWKCSKCGYEWTAAIYSRAKNGRGCPACANRVVYQGKNDLANLFPSLASEWDYAKNGDLKPDEIVYGSHNKVWWKCSKCGFEWEAKIVSRTRGSGCPSCAHVIVWSGHTDLETVNPELAKEWSVTRNESLTPSMVLPKSEKIVWWTCPKCGNEYKASVKEKSNGKKCPYCK